MQGTCGKCDGKGRIAAFSHVNNGLCYWCGGTGKLEVRDAPAPAPAVAAPNPRLAAQKAWLLTCTRAQLRGMTWAQIFAAHNLAGSMHHFGELSDDQFDLVHHVFESWVD